MMFARCPACQTVFRVRPEHLRARRGEVRCGHCFTPFNALEHLLTGTEAAQTATGMAPPPSSAPRAPVPTVEAAAPPTAPQASPIIPPGATPKTPAPATAEQPPASSADENPALDFEIPEVWRSIREHQNPSVTAAPPVPPPEPSAPVAPWPKLDTDGPVKFHAARPEKTQQPPVTLPTPDFAPRCARRQRSPADAPLPEDVQPSFSSALAQAGAERIEPDARQKSTPPPAEPHSAPPARTGEIHAHPTNTNTAPQADSDADTEHQIAHLDQRYGPSSGAAKPRRWLAGLSLGILLGMLAVQSAYLFRQEITQTAPSLRPFYLAACQNLGCTLPLPQDSERIGIVTSELQSDPRAPGRYTLHASVRNNAPYPQAWPQLELTLTDTTDRPVARRVLTPQEWAHAETAKLRAGFPAGRDQPVELHFDAPEVAPTGYRLYVFYP